MARALIRLVRRRSELGTAVCVALLLVTACVATVLLGSFGSFG